MFNFLNIELFPITLLSANASGVVLSGPGAAEADPERLPAPQELPLPWRTELQRNTDVFSLLKWNSAISVFAGRDDEMAELRRWATEGPPLSVRFVTGEGGVGKTRLAAEFASVMRREGWAAGFPDLRMLSAYEAGASGTLLLIDYPEEHTATIGEMFGSLRRMEGHDALRLRVLFLSRRDADAWREVALDANVIELFDWKPLHLDALPPASAYEVMHSALEKAGEALNTVPPPVSVEVFEGWMQQAPHHERALFQVAVGVFCALNPDLPLVDYKAQDVMKALIDRELLRLRNAGGANGLDRALLPRLVGLAAVSDHLDRDGLAVLKTAAPDLGIGDVKTVVDALRRTSWWREDKVERPQPDILAALFLVTVLNEDRGHASEWLWAAIAPDPEAALERIGRLAHDAEVVLGLHGSNRPRLSEWLRQAVADNVGRCRAVQPTLSDAALPMGLLPAAVAVWTCLGAQSDDDPDLAGNLNNLSSCLSNSGDAAGALAAIREAVKVYRRLAQARPARFEPDLAMSLNNLSSCLSASGDAAGALAAIREAVEIRRRLAQASPARFEPNLATSLNNLSNCLSDNGDAAGALAAIREAVKVYRRLAQASPARFEPDLAGNLNNLSNCLSASGDAAGALAAIREAVKVYRRLAQASPARFEPDLGASLGNLGQHLRDADDIPAARAALEEGVRLLAPYAERYPGSPPARWSVNNRNALSALPFA